MVRSLILVTWILHFTNVAFMWCIRFRKYTQEDKKKKAQTESSETIDTMCRLNKQTKTKFENKMIRINWANISWHVTCVTIYNRMRSENKQTQTKHIYLCQDTTCGRNTRRKEAKRNLKWRFLVSSVKSPDYKKKNPETKQIKPI